MGARFYKENQYIDQFISTFDFIVDLETSGISSKIVDYCDETYGSANWDWHFKHLDKDTSKVFVSFKNENDAFEFWWWYQINGNENIFNMPT